MMIYKPSILNVASGLFLIGIIIYTIFNYAELAKEEGWGVVGMVGLFGFGLLLLIIDFIIQIIFKNRQTVNIIGAVIGVVALILILN